MSSISLPVLPSDQPADSRLDLIGEWLSGLAATGGPAVTLSSLRPASADASFRRYFRVEAASSAAADPISYIVMDAPPPVENVRPFMHVAALFSDIHLSVPQIVAHDAERGLLLLSDLGSTTYFHALTPDTAHKLYMDAIDSLVLLQTHGQHDGLPEYDREFLLRELMLFPEWYINQHLGITLSTEQSDKLNKVFDAILANVIAQPQVVVHRDYHSRNLMVLPQGNPGILDFQDARYGPLTYDLVSLLRDAYVQWDEEMVLDWAIRYWEKAKRAGLPVNPDIDSFYRDFEFMGLQRHLKILGIFARLAHRDGKSDYLNDIPVVMQYVRKTAHRYSVLIPLLRLLDELEDKAPQVGYTF